MSFKLSFATRPAARSMARWPSFVRSASAGFSYCFFEAFRGSSWMAPKSLLQRTAEIFGEEAGRVREEALDSQSRACVRGGSL